MTNHERHGRSNIAEQILAALNAASAAQSVSTVSSQIELQPRRSDTASSRQTRSTDCGHRS